MSIRYQGCGYSRRSIRGVKSVSTGVATLTSLLCTGMMVGTAFAADLDDKAAPVVAQQSCGLKTAAELQKVASFNSWIVKPSYQSSLSNDVDCWRTNLWQKYGVAIMSYSVGFIESDVLNHYIPPANKQVYTGQRPTGGEHTSLYTIFDLSRYGIPDGQIVLGTINQESNFAPAAPATIPFFTLANASYYQTFYDKKFEFSAGIMTLDKQFLAQQVGANIANILGPNSSIFYELGASLETLARPAAVVKWNITNNWYNRAGVFQSIATSTNNPKGQVDASGNSQNFIQVTQSSNPGGYRWNLTPMVNGVQWPTTRAAFIDEIGYKKEAAPGELMTWVRAAGIYNTSKYGDLRYDNALAPNVNAYTHNAGVIALADQQIWQLYGSAPKAGFYVGGEVAFANPAAAVYSQDYQLRFYTIGLFNRPADQIVLTWERQGVSKYALADLNDTSLCRGGIECLKNHVDTLTGYYNTQIMPGLHLITGAAIATSGSPLVSPNALTFGTNPTCTTKTVPACSPQNDIRNVLTFLAGVYVNY